MHKTIIIEDEDLIRKMIVAMVKKIPSINFIGDASSVSEGILLCNATKPDLILLDIQLGDGNGFTLLEKINCKPKVIFITAYDEYAINAIKTGALDYILKPIDEDELLNAIEKIHQNHQDTQQFDQAALSFKGDNEKLILRTQEGLHILKFHDILYCHGDGPYTQFHTTTGIKITISKPLKEYETLLPAKDFARCHQSYIVNVNEIVRIDKSDFIILKDGSEVPLSSRKKKWFIDSFFS